MYTYAQDIDTVTNCCLFVDSLRAKMYLIIAFCIQTRRSRLKYSQLVEGGASDSQRKDFLAVGEPTPITLRVPKKLKDAAAEEARLRGVSFSVFIRNCIIRSWRGLELARRSRSSGQRKRRNRQPTGASTAPIPALPQDLQLSLRGAIGLSKCSMTRASSTSTCGAKGCLWVYGANELSLRMKELDERGAMFKLNRNGGRPTGAPPGGCATIPSSAKRSRSPSLP